MKVDAIAAALFCGTLLLAGTAMAVNRVWLEDVDRSAMSCGEGVPFAGRSASGGLISIKGKTYAHGLGTHADSRLEVPLASRALAFDADVGLDDEVKSIPAASVVFNVWTNGHLAATSGRLRRAKRKAHLHVDLTHVNVVMFEVTDAGDGTTGDHADWADAVITFKDGMGPARPCEVTYQLFSLTPHASLAPRVNGAGVLALRPAHPFLWRIPVTGLAPIDLQVKLPAGLVFDPTTRIVSGSLTRKGTYPITVIATNSAGRASRTISLVVGDKLALTPPMGWNSWNAFGTTVTEKKILEAAKALLETGLADHGWNYVIVDDYWTNRPGETEDATLMAFPRSADGTIRPNRRFSSMKQLADFIHSKGLRAGLYSSPGPTTCGGCTGSWRHERQDAATFAAWGFDYLKYDLCSYAKIALGSGLDRARLPFLAMGKALAEQNRDLVFSIVQYGNDNVSLWGSSVYAQSWRTTADVFDTWGSVSGAIRKQSEVWPWSAPGAWNDPDMLCVGRMVWNRGEGSRLTPNEQYTQMSLWCLAAAPLLIGCDLTRLDPFTLSLLTNDEVIDIDQDPLGLGAACIAKDGSVEIWARPLAGGDIAVGLFNTSMATVRGTFDLKAAGLEGTWRVRDLWRQRDEGEFTGTYTQKILGHATHLVRMGTVPGQGRLRTGLTDIRENAWRSVFEARR